MAEAADLWLAINSASGSIVPQTVAGVRDALAAAGAPPARILDLQASRPPDRAALAAAGVGRLAIMAGDGTVNALVTALDGWDGKILVLPGGTANLLSRALHGDRDAAMIAAALPRLRTVRRHAIRGSRGLALIEMLAGPGAAWSDVREGLRDGDLFDVAASGAAAMVQSITGPMVQLRSPPIGRDGGYAGLRIVAGTGHLEVSGYGAETFSDYLRQGVALLKRDFREGPHDPLGCHRAVVCCSPDGSPIDLMVDGERRTGEAEERFSLAELSVDLLAMR